MGEVVHLRLPWEESGEIDPFEYSVWATRCDLARLKADRDGEVWADLSRTEKLYRIRKVDIVFLP